MPIYEYRCDNCAHEFETIQKVSEAPLTTCPACSQETLRKKVSAAGFRLKGGGWYETDFKAGRKKNVAGEDGSAGAGKGSADSGTGGGDKGGTDKSGGGTSGADKAAGVGSSGKSETSKSSSDAKGSSAKSKASE